MTTINNLPNYAYNYPYIVVTKDNDGFWFYGAYKTFDKAQAVADNINGYVVANC